MGGINLTGPYMTTYPPKGKYCTDISERPLHEIISGDTPRPLPEGYHLWTPLYSSLMPDNLRFKCGKEVFSGNAANMPDEYTRLTILYEKC
jgi:hypothetical protein